MNTFMPPEFAQFKQPDFQASIEKLVREHALKVEELTEKQLAEVIRQALVSGDLVRQVVVRSNAQSVVYLPYNRVQELEARIKELEEKLSEHCIHFDRVAHDD